ncbi:MAG: DUF937 domain-containing protein [Rhodoglobus sp.]
MAHLDGLLELIPVNDIATQLGIPKDLAEGAVQQLVPTILSGMAANAQHNDGAISLEKALSTHSQSIDGVRATVDKIDTVDGEKIANNVFGSKKNEVVAALASTSNSSMTQDVIAKMLPMVAPIVISWLASQFFGKKDAAAPAPPAPASSGGIGDLLGGLLGGSQGNDIVGSVLGGLLGGGKR